MDDDGLVEVCCVRGREHGGGGCGNRLETLSRYIFSFVQIGGALHIERVRLVKFNLLSLWKPADDKVLFSFPDMSLSVNIVC